MKHAEAILLKSAAVETVTNLMNGARAQYDQLVLEEERYKAASAQDALFLAQFEEMYKQASPSERAEIEKVASVHAAALAKITDPLEKMAYQQGAMDGAAMADSQGGNPAAEPQLPGGQDGAHSIEEIAAMLEQAVASGEIDEATAKQVLQELAGAQGGAGAAGGAAGGDAGAAMGGMPGGAPEAPAQGDPAELAKAAAIFTKFVK